MCYVTATELKNNLSYYLEKSEEEDVYVTKNNKVVSVIINPQLKALYDAVRLINETEIDKSITMSDDDILFEAIAKKCGF